VSKAAPPVTELDPDLRCREKWQHGRTVIKYFGANTVACRYGIPHHLAGANQHADLVNAVELAIARVVLEQPVMQVCVTGAARKNYARFERVSSIDLNQHISWRNIQPPEDYSEIRHQILTEENNGFYPDLETRPGWKTVILTQPDSDSIEVILSWCHIHFDGMSAKIFHERLLSALNNGDKDGTGPDLKDRVLDTTASKTDLPPSQEAIAPVPVSAGYVLKTVPAALKPSFMASKQTSTWPPPIRATSAISQLETFSIGQETLQNVLAACRDHKTTLTGLLDGICLVALARQIRDQKPKPVGFSTSFSFRRYVPPSPPGYPGLDVWKIMFNLVSEIPHHVDMTLFSSVQKAARELDASGQSGNPLESLSELMWTASSRFSGEIKKAIDNGLKNQQAGLMRFIDDWPKFFQAESKKPRPESWILSNIGVIDGTAPQEGGWTIQSALLSFSGFVTGPPLNISTASVKGGDLSVCVSWQDGTVDDAMGKRFAKELEEWLVYVGSKA